MKKDGAMSDKRLKRIFEIHKVLRRGNRGWSAEELCEVCKEVDPTVDKRTVGNDLKFLRDVLHAPLPKRANKHSGYRYDYTAHTNSILEGLDNPYTSKLNEALALLRQLAESKEFVGLGDLLVRLEQRVAVTTAEQNSFIAFDEAELVGREHLVGLYRAIQKRAFLRVTYRTFQGEEPMIRHVIPLLLKEYNNRWVLVVWEKDHPMPQNLPLDRIGSFRETGEDFTYPKTFDSPTYFQHLLGTSKTGGEPQLVILQFTAKRGKYVATKKIHPRQEIDWLPNGKLEVRLLVELNQELEARLLEFGRDVTVMAPPDLRNRIKENLRDALSHY